MTLGSSDLKRAENFYDALLSESGNKQLFKTESMIAWGKDFNSPILCLTLPFDGKPSSVGNGCMVALKVENAEIVKKMYEKAIQLGAKCEGGPGFRNKNFYGAYFRDLDGNKLNFYCYI